MSCNSGAHLVVVSPLLDELVDYFLGLLVTFLLQVSDERVQMARTVIRLHYRLMGLNDTSNTCKHTATHQWSSKQKKKTKENAQRQREHQACFSPSSSSVRVSANTSSALFSPRSPPVAKSRFSSALEASCANTCVEKTEKTDIAFM